MNGTLVPGLTNSKALALWTWLALEGGSCSRVALASRFWGELDDSAARANLRQTLLRLRQALPGHIEADTRQVAIPAKSQHEIDVNLLDAGLSGNDPDPAQMLALDPSALFGGLQLRGAPEFDEWASRRREALLLRYQAVLERQAELRAERDPGRWPSSCTAAA